MVAVKATRHLANVFPYIWLHSTNIRYQADLSTRPLIGDIRCADRAGTIYIPHSPRMLTFTFGPLGGEPVVCLERRDSVDVHLTPPWRDFVAFGKCAARRVM